MTRNRARWVVGLACSLVLLPPAVQARPDKDDKESTEIIKTGVKFGAEQIAKVFISAMYKNACKGKSPQGAEAMICGVMGSFSGDAEKEWKAHLDEQLTHIARGIAELNDGLRQVQADQQTLLRDNQKILARLDEIVAETAAAPAIGDVRRLWDERFTPMIQQKSELNAERLLAFADQVVNRNKVHEALGRIHGAIVDPQIGGKEPLLRLYARRMAIGMSEIQGASLEAPYDYLEAVLADLLTEQRKGEAMYVWAASALEADCEKRGDKACTVVPHKAAEYDAIFAQHVEQQMAEFNAALEWLVLASSDTHARAPGFLHKDAARVFAAADLFTAANLRKGFGLRGRVIALGDSFDGALTVAGRAVKPARAANLVPTVETRVDWWRATGKPGAYNEVRFSNQWKVYPYHLPEVKAGSYSVATSLPWKQPSFAVGNVDLATSASAPAGATGDGIVPFGSFVAVARAGGAFALMSGEWVMDFPDGGRTVTAVGDLEGDLARPAVETQIPQVRLMEWATIKWSVKKPLDNQGVEGRLTGRAVRQPAIVSPDGGPLTLNVRLGDTWDAVCPQGGCAYSDFDRDTVIMVHTNYQKRLGGERYASIEAGAEVQLGDGSVAWRDSMNTSKAAQVYVKRGGLKTGQITLVKGKPVDLALKVSAKLNVPTSGLDSTRFYVLAVLRPEIMYVTP